MSVEIIPGDIRYSGKFWSIIGEFWRDDSELWVP